MVPSTKHNDQDWLASLARQATSSDINTSIKRENQKDGGPFIHQTTKALRIQHRQEKRAKREEQKRKRDEERHARMTKKKQKQRGIKAMGSTAGSKNKRCVEQPVVRKGMTSTSMKALIKLSANLTSTLSSKQPPLKQQPTTSILINGLPPPPKGKATKQSTLTPQSTELQPRSRDYNGQGLARPSLFLPLNDATFIPRLEEEFAEHIPGFFGKAKTGGVKRQREGDMLWRRRLEEKQMESSGKKKKRVVAMI